MAVRTPTRAFAGAFALFLAAVLAPCSQAHQHDEAAYSISSPNTALVGYVILDTALIRIAGPSGSMRRAVLTLNGHDVTKALEPDACRRTFP
jgi:hypothetical protein